MKKKIRVELQIAVKTASVPSKADFERWAKAALTGKRDHTEITVRIVDEMESKRFNSIYRNKHYPTNVLSFPFETPAGVSDPTLGDLVVCAPIVIKEAKEQGKSVESHFAHLVIHGILHLLGYDHETDEEAQVMELEEVRIMESLGLSNPYGTVHVPM